MYFFILMNQYWGKTKKNKELWRKKYGIREFVKYNLLSFITHYFSSDKSSLRGTKQSRVFRDKCCPILAVFLLDYQPAETCSTRPEKIGIASCVAMTAFL
jgi:hypothetical protein